jgi:hypothetical protein
MFAGTINGASVSRMMRGEGDCANIRRTRLDVFSLDENVTTPEDAEKGRVSYLWWGYPWREKGEEGAYQ